MKEYKWEKRSLEWIKENPNKPTWYKSNSDGSEYIDKKRIRAKSVAEILSENRVVKKVKRIKDPLEDYIGQSSPWNPPKIRKGTKDAGIYAITCEANRSAYIGQSVNVGSRLRNHKMIIINEYQSDSKVYVDIIKDWKEYGPDSFKFVKIKEMPEALQKELLDAETECMIEYLENGWTLYNLDHCNNTYVSPSLRPLILNLILAIKDKPDLIDRIKALID